MGDSKLNIELHIQYWQRCLKTLLPTQYTSTDSSRMSLGFFILSALDILGAIGDVIEDKQRADIKEWILKCQHPNGGFCGSPNHRYPDKFYVDVGQGKEQMDPANLPATYFAILSLSFVGEFKLVKRRECLRWLNTLQREDGSFGELITGNGKIEGGNDTRYCFIAMAIRWMLRGDVNGQQGEEDVDVEKLVDNLRAGQVGYMSTNKIQADDSRLTMVDSRNHLSMRHMVGLSLYNPISILISLQLDIHTALSHASQSCIVYLSPSLQPLQ